MKKLLVFFLGLVCVLAVLELGLRAVGAYYHGRVKVNTALSGAGKYSILCLGDSFTYGLGAPPQDSYPRQLEKLLSRDYPGAKITVNGGIMAQNSTQVLQELQSNINRFKPQIIVLMIGLNNCWNDYGYIPEYQTRSWKTAARNFLYHIKLYKLAKLLRQELLLAYRERQRSSDTEDRGGNSPSGTAEGADTLENLELDYFTVGLNYEDKRRYQAAQGYYLKALRQKGYKIKSALAWGRVKVKQVLAPYFPDRPRPAATATMMCDLPRRPEQFGNAPPTPEFTMGDFQFAGARNRAMRYFKTQQFQRALMELKPYEASPQADAGFLVQLGEAYKETYNYDQALEVFNRALRLDPGNTEANFHVAWIYRSIKDEPFKALAVYQNALLKVPDSVSFLSRILEIYEVTGKSQEAAKFFKTAARLRPDLAPYIKPYLDVTKFRDFIEQWIAGDIEKMLEICRNNQVILVLQDYPCGVSIFGSPPTGIFKAVAARNRIPFVDNWSVFHKLQEHDRYFVADGHCNSLGYSIVARNVYQVVKPLLK